MLSFCMATVEQGLQLVGFERSQCIYLSARQQRADNLERRVLGSGANERYSTVFDSSEQAVLL